MITIVGMDPSIYKEITCKNCASILRYLPEAVQSCLHYDYTGDSERVYWIDCPSCRKEVYLPRR